MMAYSAYTKKLAPGALLALLTLKAGEAFRFSADDLSDFYYTFKVPRARAKRNCIGTKVFPSEVRSLSCFDPAVEGLLPSLGNPCHGRWARSGDSSGEPSCPFAVGRRQYAGVGL